MRMQQVGVASMTCSCNGASRKQRPPGPAREPRELTLSLFERRPLTVMACKFIGLAPRDAKDDPEDVRTTTIRLHALAGRSWSGSTAP